MHANLARHEVEVLTAYRSLRAACGRDSRQLVTQLTIERLVRSTEAMYRYNVRSRGEPKRTIEMTTAYRGANEAHEAAKNCSTPQ